MNEHIWSSSISRRDLLRGAAAAAVASAGLPVAARAAGQPAAGHIANVRVSHDNYKVHIEPSLVVNPKNPRELLAACQVSPTPEPSLISTYYSFDGGATWHNGALPHPPAGQAPASDDVTVAFDSLGRGYLCASRAGNTPGGRAMFAWRTDDGGRSFSPAVTLLDGPYFDHPEIAAGTGQTDSQRYVYIAWAGGANGESPSDIGFTRSSDGGKTFEPARTIHTDRRPSITSAGVRVVAAADGLVCVAFPEASSQSSSGTLTSEMTVLCSTDAGHSFAAPVSLGTGQGTIGLPGHVLPNGSDPAIAVAPNNRTLYAAYPIYRHGATHSDIVVRASPDRGHSWSKPVTATPHDNVIYFQPDLAVDAAGRVGMSAFALANGRVNEVLLVSHPGELRFGPPIQVTTAPFDPQTATGAGHRNGKHGAWWIGDYQGITATGDSFQLVWNDARTGKLELFAASVRST